MDKKINDSRHHLWSLYFNLRFSVIQSQSQQKLVKKITYFAINFRLENLTYFITLNLLNIAKKILLQNTAKTHSLYKFSGKQISGCLFQSMQNSEKKKKKNKRQNKYKTRKRRTERDRKVTLPTYFSEWFLICSLSDS